MSRPEKPIDWLMVDKLLEGGCLGTEICTHFNMHHDTFYRRVEEKFNVSFTAYSAEKKRKGETNLRMAQYLKAIGETKKGDNTLLIWLGKQRLEQKDTPLDLQVNAETDSKYKEVMEQIKSLQASKSEITSPHS
jgi:hypothetical protein